MSSSLVLTSHSDSDSDAQATSYYRSTTSHDGSYRSLAYTIETSLACGLFDEVALGTEGNRRKAEKMQGTRRRGTAEGRRPFELPKFDPRVCAVQYELLP